jgi:hypothetical protein
MQPIYIQPQLAITWLILAGCFEGFEAGFLYTVGIELNEGDTGLFGLDFTDMDQ